MYIYYNKIGSAYLLKDDGTPVLEGDKPLSSSEFASMNASYSWDNSGTPIRNFVFVRGGIVTPDGQYRKLVLPAGDHRKIRNDAFTVLPELNLILFEENGFGGPSVGRATLFNYYLEPVFEWQYSRRYANVYYRHITAEDSNPYLLIHPGPKLDLLIGKDGKTVDAAEVCYQVDSFPGGSVWKFGGKYGLKKENGDILLDFKFKEYSISSTFNVVFVKEKKWAAYDFDGNLVEELCGYEDHMQSWLKRTKGLWGFLDPLTHEEIAPFVFSKSKNYYSCQLTANKSPELIDYCKTHLKSCDNLCTLEQADVITILCDKQSVPTFWSALPDVVIESFYTDDYYLISRTGLSENYICRNGKVVARVGNSRPQPMKTNANVLVDSSALFVITPNGLKGKCYKEVRVCSTVIIATDEERIGSTRRNSWEYFTLDGEPIDLAEKGVEGKVLSGDGWPLFSLKDGELILYDENFKPTGSVRVSGDICSVNSAATSHCAYSSDLKTRIYLDAHLNIIDRLLGPPRTYGEIVSDTEAIFIDEKNDYKRVIHTDTKWLSSYGYDPFYLVDGKKMVVVSHNHYLEIPFSYIPSLYGGLVCIDSRKASLIGNPNSGYIIFSKEDPYNVYHKCATRYSDLAYQYNEDETIIVYDNWSGSEHVVKVIVETIKLSLAKLLPEEAETFDLRFLCPLV